MAGELLQKINKLKELITQKNNEEFGKKAVEILNPDKVDEKLMGGEEHLGVDKAEVEMEAEALSIEKELRLSVSEESSGNCWIRSVISELLKSPVFKESIADFMDEIFDWN